MKKRLLPIAAILTLLTACSNGPTSVVVAPQIMQTNAYNFMHKSAQLDVIDSRSSTHVVQILKEGEAATLYPSQAPLASVISKSLSDSFKVQNLSIKESAANSITVFIDKALITVNQSMVKYTAKNEIALRVSISNGDQTLNKKYNATGNSNGALNADIAVLERDFNQQVGKVLGQILADQAIQEFIK